MTIGFPGFYVLGVALLTIEIAGFLLLLWGFVGLRRIAASETGKTTLVGEIKPNFIKLGLVLIIISLAVSLALRFTVVY